MFLFIWKPNSNNFVDLNLYLYKNIQFNTVWVVQIFPNYKNRLFPDTPVCHTMVSIKAIYRTFCLCMKSKNIEICKINEF